MNVDWDRINSFINTEDAEELEWLKDMIQTLISNYEERLVEMNEIIKNKDNSQLTSMLHQMKGITANFGLETLKQITQQAETFSKADNIDLSIIETSKLSPIWQETKVELKTKLGIE